MQSPDWHKKLTWKLCDIQLLFSDNYYPRGSTEEATNMSIWMIKIIILNMHSRWSVDIILRTNTMHIIFRRASFAEKQGGMCWHLILARYRLQWIWSRVNWFSAWKDSRRRVEPLWCFGYIHSTLSYGPKLYSKWHSSMFRVVFGQSRLQDDLGWRITLKELSSSRRGNRLWYINHLNPSSYAKVRGNTLQTEAQRKYGARCQTLVW